MYNFNLRGLTFELRQRIKVAAAMERITMQELIIKAVEEYLKKLEKKHWKSGKGE